MSILQVAAHDIPISLGGREDGGGERYSSFVKSSAVGRDCPPDRTRWGGSHERRQVIICRCLTEFGITCSAKSARSVAIYGTSNPAGTKRVPGGPIRDSSASKSSKLLSNQQSSALSVLPTPPSGFGATCLLFLKRRFPNIHSSSIESSCRVPPGSQSSLFCL
jgi:hypothetical protein